MFQRRRGLASCAIASAVIFAASVGFTTGRRPGPPAKDGPGVRPDQPAEASRFAVSKRSPDGVTPVPYARYASAWEAARKLPLHSTRTGKVGDSLEELERRGEAPDALGTWTPLGPGNVGGRSRGLVIHPSSPATMWSAGVAGGVWKSTNGGSTWTPVSDLLANIAVNSLALDPGNPNVLYAGTGEGYYNADGVRGAGIFKSTDGGSNFALLAATAGSAFEYVNDIVVSTGNGSRVYAATRSGVHRSTDGGTSWTPVLPSGLTAGCLDLAIRTDQGANDVVFASCGSFVQATVYRNLDADGVGSWTPSYTELEMGRTSLAIAPSNQAVIYALASQRSTSPNASFQHGLLAVIRSTDGGGTWSDRWRNNGVAATIGNLLLTNPLYANLAGCGFGSSQLLNQGWYDNVIAVDPVNPDRVWAGGIDLFRSADGGATWGLASYWWFGSGVDPQFAHADNHVFAFHPGYNGSSNQSLYVGSDGGLFRTDNAVSGTTSQDPCGNTPGSLSWSILNNGYAVTQFYHGVPYPGGATYFGGTQDNGTVRGTNAAGPNAWTTLLGGDGGYVAVDPTNTNVLYAENTGLSIKKSTNGGSGWFSAVSGISADSFLFINPFVMDPGAGGNQRLWTGGQKVWRTTNGGSSWLQAAAGLGEYVSAIAVSPANGNFVLAGTRVGLIARTSTGLTDAAASWPSVNPMPGYLYVSWLTFAPGSTTTAYATYSTFGVPHVWKSTDSGASWSDVSGNLPDVPVHSLAVDPTDATRLYVGTDVGVFSSTNGGTTWNVENTGFANVITEALAVDGSNLFAFTHGRGAWRVSLTPVAGAASFHSLTPCRVLDTRNAVGPLGGPALAASETRTFTVTGTCSIPSSAKAIAVNLTAVLPAASGYLKAFPADAVEPTTSVLNFVPGRVRANNALLGLATSGAGTVKITNGSGGNTHVLLDVTGYFQ